MRRRRLALLVAALGGAATGDALWHGAMQERSAGPPPGWRMEESRVPYRLTALSGPLALSPAAWSLDFWRAIRPPGHGAASLSAVVEIPEGGQIELWPAADPGHQGEAGVGLVLERIGEPSSGVVQATETGRRRVNCTAPLPAPGDRTRVSIAPTAEGVVATVGETATRCTVQARGSGPVIRPGLRRVQVSALVVGEEVVPAPGPEGRPLWALAGAVTGLMFCLLELTRLPSSAVLLSTAPLLLAIWLGPRDLRLWAETARLSFVPSAWLGAGIPLGLALLARAGLHLGRALQESRRAGITRDWPLTAVVAAGLPVIASAIYVPGAADPALLALATAGGVGGVGLGLVALLRRLGSLRPRRAAAWCVAVGSALGFAISLSHPLGREAVTGAMLAGSAAALLLWANVNAARARWLNLSSLGSLAVLVFGVELTLRNVPAGQAWGGGGARLAPDDIYGWVPTAEAEFQAMKEGQASDYPSSGNPVALAPPDGRPRIVAMGGSTTGGAFQNDDLSEFYPAKLDGMLEGRAQVLNQGVGGWTTWHIRRFVERNLDALAPDVLILYVGHNDLLTPVPRPYSQLYAAWDSPGLATRAARSLGSLRIFGALRYLLTSLRSPGDRVAVPLPEARENLRAILAQITGRGGRALLASEGLAPDPGPLLEYNRMMAELAASTPGVGYRDLASLLHEQDSAAVFLDDCHLSGLGHEIVAQALQEALLAEGMIGGADGP